ncbi:major histocompatibility complex class I-related protein 1-like [Paroedura picta]|uniref:major histocompatibility complex class I-related protein 1-like n=1 Tax=Paroedura picta TaxID=143630 RepID=UPI0040566A32
MGLPWECPLILTTAAAFFLGGCSGSSWHSLRYFQTMIWGPDQGVSDYIAVVYLDEQLGSHYNSSTRRTEPRAPWIRKIEKDDPHFWDWNTQRTVNHEQRMKMHLMSLQNIYNLSRGLHIFQRTFSCELSGDGRKKGAYQFGYNGEDYIGFDKDTLTWTAVVMPAQVTKRQWDADVERSRYLKAALDQECIGLLKKFLNYGSESLLRREPPVVTVRRRPDFDGLETLVCRAHGFHPKAIDATWRKDGEVWEQETFRGGVVPNSDGTYHTWLSIKVHPEDRSRYRCHVEHDSLPEPLDITWEEPALTGAVILVVILTVVMAALFVLGIILYFWRRRRIYQAALQAPPDE